MKVLKKFKLKIATSMTEIINNNICRKLFLHNDASLCQAEYHFCLHLSMKCSGLNLNASLI